MKFLKRYHLKNFNFILVTFVTALSIIGIMAVGSAQKSMQGKQIFGVILGLLVMLLFSIIDYKWICLLYTSHRDKRTQRAGTGQKDFVSGLLAGWNFKYSSLDDGTTDADQRNWKD